MKKKLYISILTTAIMLMIISCDREPMAPPEPVINPISISQLRDMYESGVVTVDTSVYIQGVVVLTPEMKNTQDFMAYVMDTTGGICITVSDVNTLTMDSEVKILCNGVSFLEYNGLLQFGDKESLSISGQIEIISLTASIDPDTVTIAQLLTGEYESRYVYVPGVQFDEPGTFSGSNVLTDCISEIDVYTDGDATFSGTTMPTGNGALKGVSSAYNGEQILLRDATELDMTGSRCGEPSSTYITQDFTTLAKFDDVSVLEGWSTFPQEGTKTWYGNNTSSTYRWVQATAYNSGQASVITWMLTPEIDLTLAVNPYVQFETLNGFDNGATLELFVSSDYDGSDTPWTSTWEQLTFTPAPSNTGNFSGKSFVSSGQVDLSAYIGTTVYIAWLYTGSSTQTTTWEVDNVLVAEN